MASFEALLSHWPRDNTRYSECPVGAFMWVAETCWRDQFTEEVFETTLASSASPCSNCGPHILSQSMNRLIILPTKLFLPYIAQVTTVLSPAGLNVKSTIEVASMGRFQSIFRRTSSPGLLSTMVAEPAPMSLLPSQLQTEPTPEAGPL